MKNLQIYYFSGTGNARNVARWMDEEATSKGIHSEMISVSQNRLAREMSTETMVGFISPTHGFNYPPLMLNFIIRFPHSLGRQSVFLMNTRAGMKIGNFYIPGLSGLALWLSALILWMKGYRIVGLRSVDLPSNWISLHPGYGPKTVSAMYMRCDKKIRQFAQQIFSGKKVYRAIYDIVQDLLVSPIAVIYFMIGRFILSKTLVASRDCNKCGICVKDCPVKAIYLVDGRPYWSFRCESCMKCMNSCPKRAIQAVHGMFTAILMLVNTLVIGTFYRHFPVSEWGIPGGDSFSVKLIRITVEGFLFFFFLVISYRLVHWLRRFRWFDALIIYTSLTKFRFWRRYKAPVK